MQDRVLQVQGRQGLGQEGEAGRGLWQHLLRLQGGPQLLTGRLMPGLMSKVLRDNILLMGANLQETCLQLFQ